MTGWLTSLAWIATVATETLFAGTIISGILILDYPNSYVPQSYQGTLLTWLVICVCIFINVVIPNMLPKLEVFTLFFHILGFVAIVATLWALTPHYTPSSVVWTKTIDSGGWGSVGLSLCVGFLGNVATFVGADASVHMAEEVSNPALNIPRAILGAMVINGAVGFIMMITTLYCLGDIKTVLGTATGYPFIQIFKDSVKSTAGATVMSAVVLCLTWVCATGILTTASRMTWSFARDNGLPGSRWLSKVNPRTKIPVVAVLTVSVISALLTLIYIGSYTAFADVISLTITGFYGSYFLPASLLLYRRFKKQILPYGSPMDSRLPPGGSGMQDFDFEKDGQPPPTTTTKSPTSENAAKIKSEGGADVSPPEYAPDVAHGTVLADAPLIWGPWHLPEPWGTINNAYACVYMIFVIFWSVWPPDNHPTVSEMNYSVVVTGGVMILSAAWYFIRARHVYKGPTVDQEVVEAVMRHGSVVSVS